MQVNIVTAVIAIIITTNQLFSQCVKVVEDISHLPPAQSDTPCYQGANRVIWKGNEYIAVNYGFGVAMYRVKPNGLQLIWKKKLLCPIDSPCPGIIPADYDCNLRNVIICNNARYFFVSAYMNSLISQELDWESGMPKLKGVATITDSYKSAGGVTYIHGGTQYVVISGLNQETDPKPKTYLYRVETNNLVRLHEVPLSIKKTKYTGPKGYIKHSKTVLGYRYSNELSQITNELSQIAGNVVMGGIKVGNTLYISDVNHNITMWSVSHGSLTYIGNAPFNGYFYSGIQMQYDDGVIMTPTNNGLELWEQTKTGTVVGTGGAISYPLVWSSIYAGNTAYLSMINVGTKIIDDVSASKPHQRWMGGVKCGDKICATSNSIFSVIDPSCTYIFSDGFERPLRWSGKN